MKSDPGQIERLVSEAFGASPLSGDYDGAEISFGRLDEDADFIRVLVRMRNLDKLSDDEADTVTADIEQKISEQDDRFPSIRFAEA